MVVKTVNFILPSSPFYFTNFLLFYTLTKWKTLFTIRHRWGLFCFVRRNKRDTREITIRIVMWVYFPSLTMVVTHVPCIDYTFVRSLVLWVPTVIETSHIMSVVNFRQSIRSVSSSRIWCPLFVTYLE